MGGNIVKLIFSYISTGSGWADLRKHAEAAAEELRTGGRVSPRAETGNGEAAHPRRS